MARVYHVEIAQFAAGADAKWVDNLLSHFAIPGVEGSRQGLSRRITTEGVYHIALIRVLCRQGGLSLANAVTVSGQFLAVGGQGAMVFCDELQLQFDRIAFQRRIDAAIADAVECIAPARRGRPPKSVGQRG